MTDPSTGQEHKAIELLGREVPFSVLQLACPSDTGVNAARRHLYAGAQIPSPAIFEAPDDLCELLRECLPQLDSFAPPTITEN